MKSLYIINPKSIPYYYDIKFVEAIGRKPLVVYGELSVVTLAALAPKDFHIRICDEELSAIDPKPDEHYIAITGKTNQFGRMAELATYYRSIGKKVIFGGPYASLAPEVCRPYCDCLVKGELEDIADEFFADLAEGKMKEQYEGPKSDLSRARVPRWDLYPTSRILAGSLQISRGCPFSCEFCDVIQYAGQKQRIKSIDQVLKELDLLYSTGLREIFITDDNLTATRSKMKEILSAIKWWNDKKGPDRVTLFTQMSIDAANDLELLKLCADAGLLRAYVGIETTNLNSLKSVRKYQNVRGSLVQKARDFLNTGIAITAGTVFGFDCDEMSVFQDVADFAREAAIPLLPAAALIAYRSTPLYARLIKEGRVDTERGDAMFLPWQTNMKFKNFSYEQFLDGFQSFTRQVYDTDTYQKRCLDLMESFGSQNPELLARPYQIKVRSFHVEMGQSIFACLEKMGPKSQAFYKAMAPYIRSNSVKSMMGWINVINYIQAHFVMSSLFGHQKIFASDMTPSYGATERRTYAKPIESTLLI